ncbi:MAG TPA: hypothetical protein PKO23_05995 [Candidatus Hydrogenedentes bacterium]|jgi:ketosteroid isomerase-like protein|nr:hypothetical protein [Candidatus Hydrogenedentota bacterium]
MKKLVLCMTFVLGFAVVVQAQCETDKLLEKVLLVQFAEEADIDAYDMAEFLSGYAQYRDAMDMMEKNLADARSGLEAAIAVGDSTAISSKMRAMMAADKAIFDAKQAAVSEASMLLDSAAAAKLALIVADLPKAKKALQDSLLPKAPCAMPAAACAAPAADAAAVPVAATATPEEEVMAAVNDIIAAIKAGEVEKVLGFISEDFYQPQVGDKEAVKEYAKMGKDMGYLDDVPATIKQYEAELSLEDTEVELKDGEATVYPIDAITNQGSATVELVLKKEADGTWRVIGGDAYGI